MNKVIDTQNRAREKNFKQEWLIDIIPGVTHRKKVFAVQHFDILITNKRLLFILVPQSGSDSNRYYSASLDIVLAENQVNFGVNNDEIKSIKLTPGNSYDDCCGKRQQEDGQLEVTTQKKYSFLMPHLVFLKAQQIFKEAGLIKENNL